MKTDTQIPENETIIQKAYRLLKDIPAEQWIMGTYSNSTGGCCSLGHLYRLTNENPENYEHGDGVDFTNKLIVNIRDLTMNYLTEKCKLEPGSADIVHVNDGQYIKPYTENTPKERIMHLLSDMINDGH